MKLCFTLLASLRSAIFESQKEGKRSMIVILANFRNIIRYLARGLAPDIEVQQLIPFILLDDEKLLDPVDGAVLEQSVDHESNEEEVGEGGREVDNLAAGLDS